MDVAEDTPHGDAEPHDHADTEKTSNEGGGSSSTMFIKVEVLDEEQVDQPTDQWSTSYDKQCPETTSSQEVLGVKKEQPDGSFEGEDEEKTESSSEEDEVDSGDGWIEDEEPQDEMESADEHPTDEESNLETCDKDSSLTMDHGECSRVKCGAGLECSGRDKLNHLSCLERLGESDPDRPNKLNEQSKETGSASTAGYSGDKRFVCSTCNQRFLRKAGLMIHMRAHTGEKPFQCTTCSARFTQKHRLMIHMKVHTGETPLYRCSECDKSFFERCRLRQHMQIHTGEKTHKCPECGKSFIFKKDLVRHARSHTGGHTATKPYMYSRIRNKSLCSSAFF